MVCRLYSSASSQQRSRAKRRITDARIYHYVILLNVLQEEQNFQLRGPLEAGRQLWEAICMLRFWMDEDEGKTILPEAGIVFFQTGSTFSSFTPGSPTLAMGASLT